MERLIDLMTKQSIESVEFQQYHLGVSRSREMWGLGEHSSGLEHGSHIPETLMLIPTTKKYEKEKNVEEYLTM